MVKGQTTLDAANARRQNEKEARQAKPPEAKPLTDEQKAVLPDEAHTLALMDPRSAYEKPKPLGTLEKIVETNALKGAGLWRKAADALLVIRAFKLWKEAKRTVPGPGGEAVGTTYNSFVQYAEERFGFKKTYAYDLVKAATKKPEAVTEGSAREEMKAERGKKPLTADKATDMMASAFERFQNTTGDQRDRVTDNDAFVQAFDDTMRVVFEAFSGFLNDDRWQPIEATAADEASADEAADLDAEVENTGDDVPAGTDADV